SGVIACATVNAARAIRLDDLGTLSVGAPADIAFFRLEEGDFAFHDVAMSERAGSKLLVNTRTLLAGEELERLPERDLHFWADIPERQRGAVHPGSKAAAPAGGDA